MDRAVRRPRGWRAATSGQDVSRVWIGAICTVLLSSGGCVGVLGLDDYGAIEDELCVCAELDSIGAERCRERVESALADDPEARREWLANFDERGCGTSCDEARACFDKAPVCTPSGRTCTASEECCGSSAGDEGCCSDSDGDGTCCASCMACAEAAQSPTPVALCAGTQNDASLAQCLCAAADNDICSDECQSACDDPIAVSKPCFDCHAANQTKPCGAQISQCLDPT